MNEYNTYRKRNRHGARAQAMVEFAIALPVLLALLIGLMEVGRLLLLYALVTNSSRDAARYASAIGMEDNGLTRFNYCEGIKGAALQWAILIPESAIDVEIMYDRGSSGSEFAECNLWNSSQVDPDVSVDSGDRVTVTVSTEYSPLVSLLPISPRIITSTSSRTILGIFELDN